MSFDQIVHVTIREGTEGQFLKAAAGLAAGVRETEPDTLVYRLYRSPAKDNTFVFVESYTNEAALDTHRKNPVIAEHFASVGQCLAGKPQVEVIEAV